MNSAAPASLVDENTSTPLAHIDAQEEELVLPLREYLETNGCAVTVNERTPQPITYHIAAGDLSFVKSIFVPAPAGIMRRLGIVVGSSLSDAKKLATEKQKIVVVDPVHLTPDDVVDIFTFFFAGIDNVLEKRRKRHEPNFVDTTTQMQQPPLREVQERNEQVLSQEDSKRIGTLITDVFGQDGRVDPNAGQAKKHRKRRIKGKVTGFLALLVATILLPILWYVASLTVTGITFGIMVNRLRDGDEATVRRMGELGNYWLSQSKVAFGVVAPPLRFFGQEHLTRGQERLLSFITDIGAATRQMQVFMDEGRGAVTQLLLIGEGTPGTLPVGSIEPLRLAVTSVAGSLGLAQAQLVTLLEDRTPPFSISFLYDRGQTMVGSLDHIRLSLSLVDHLLTLYPRIAGFAKPQTYLLLFQNSNELRPTGGFIGSIGLLTFDGGVISSFTIQDVYAVDGQLKGHVDPPTPVRELMGNEHWYLRDSNWDPDFKESGTKAAWFYQKETGVTVDGVIAVSVPFIVDLLSATGPLTLPDYNERISAENFFGKSLYYTQENSFPGSTQKSDFLGTLARALITKITTDKEVRPTALFQAFTAGLGSRDIQFFFTDRELQQLVEYYGWAGRVFGQAGCEGVDGDYCMFSPFAIVEANVSVSKVNYFVSRQTTREITIATDGTITETMQAAIRNSASEKGLDGQRGVGGEYRTYLRFLVAPEVLVNDITIDGAPVPSRDSKRQGVPPLPYIENAPSTTAARAIGLAFDVPAGTTKTVRISYKHTRPLSFGRGGAVLDLSLVKQAGIRDTTHTTRIHYPLYWRVFDESRSVQKSVEPDGFIAKDGELEYNSTLSRDSHNRLRFTK